MKKTMILAAIAALVSLASCQKEEVIDNNGSDNNASPVFTASIAGATKTTIALPEGSYTKIEITNASDVKCTLNSTSGVAVAANHIKPVTFGGSKLNFLPVGALPSVFSVSDTKKVHFSKGNLVATIDAAGAPTAWKFAANQYDYLGECGANETIGTAAGDIDFFGWSTASTNYGISTSTKNANYSGDFVDWGTAIDDKGTWRTLSNDEWTYLFNKHSNKWASVNDVNGYVIAPDGFTGTLSDSYTDDAALAADNLVFLPATGYRSGSGVSSVGIFGYYWSSSVLVYNNSYCVNFDSLGVSPSSGDHCDDGISVRLVTASK